MPTIKLLGGSYREGDKRYTSKSEPFEVSDKMSKLLHCSVVPASKPPPPAGDLTALRAQALQMGIDVKPQWSAAKLQHEITTHGG